MKLFIKELFVGLLLFINADISFAQFESDYTPLTSSGSLPAEFITTAKEISKQEISDLGKVTDRSAKQQFIIANNYFLRDLLLSGNVLVNDPLSRYVNKVVDQLLKDQPALRQQLHVYVTRSGDVNAYAFDKGFIFVNVGLLAQLENESQLAFILAHEITHVIKKHSVNQYIENIRLENGTSSYERGSSEERNLARYRFSKEQESEADMEGLKLMKQTGYSIKAMGGAFDVLQYSYLPFELVDFRKNFFEDEYLNLPDTLYLKKSSEVKSNDDYDDTKSSHPNIRKRRGSIEPELKVNDESSRKKYLVSETEFKNVREMARFELCRVYLIERDYVNAVYASYILSEKYMNNLYLKKTISKALYNILVNKPSDHRSFTNTVSIGNGNISSKQYVVPDYMNIEGASQKLYYMLGNMTSTELNTVALSYTYKAYKQHAGDPVLSALTDSLFSVLVNSNNLFLRDFSSKSKAEIKKSDTTGKAALAEPDQEESKYTKIKKEQQKTEVETDDNFTKYAFVGLLKDEEFVNRYTKMARGLTQKPLIDEYTNSPKIKGKKKKKKNSVPFLGIDKVLFLDPFYMKVKNDHGTEYVKYYEIEEHQKILADIQKKCADKLKLEYSTVTTKDLSESDIERYNQNAVLNDWLGERFRHGDNNSELVTSSEYIKQLIKEAGTQYVAWSGVYDSKGKAHHCTYFFILMDLESGKLMKFETRYVRSNDNRDLITSFVYNSLMHVHKKPSL
ncbi:MAG: Peptidase family [Bacteroidota bacterium]|jgi:Zn-dependent protease with chaperone function|nr:Peptidase family [Bacteroidota bacterium]